VQKQAWFVSKSGFWTEAIAHARRHRMFVSDAEAIEALQVLLKV